MLRTGLSLLGPPPPPESLRPLKRSKSVLGVPASLDILQPDAWASTLSLQKPREASGFLLGFRPSFAATRSLSPLELGTRVEIRPKSNS